MSPVKSEAQKDFMEGVASGHIKKKGLSPEEAKEFLSHKPKKKLPKRVGKKGKKK